MVDKRSIGVAILLSFITCGIYTIYWFVKLTNECNAITGNVNDTSGGMAFLLSLVTCGIYSYVWAYKMGEKIDRYEQSNSSRGLVYLLLGIFGLGIVAYCLMQDSINKIIDNERAKM